jgi:glycosyltransferase involved in cell wall biosynthesis
MTAVIMPAHNEAAVIARSLAALTEGGAPDFEIIVVCNGCSDATAEIARGFAPAVTVIETDVPSKTNALNLGDDAATSFPRIYMDADVLMSADSVRALAAELSRKGALAAAPVAELAAPEGASWAVCAFHRFFMALPYVQEGMMTAGVYAMSEAGRRRFERFPDIIADDGYVRLHFTNGERVEVAGARSTVWHPGTVADLIRIRTRSRLGLYQLHARYPELFLREAKSKDYLGAAMAILRRPSLYAAAIPYVWINLVTRLRAQRQRRTVDRYVWERDHSSRRGVGPTHPAKAG